MLRTLHRGALYDITLVALEGRERPVCVKQRAADPGAGGETERAPALLRSTWRRNPPTAVIDCVVRTGFACAGVDAPTDALLASEAERIRASAGTWNHEVIALVERDDGRALVMPFHEGDRLCDLSRAEQRVLFPRMLPAMWRALRATPHGDLHRANMIVQPGWDRFVLIDPSARVYREDHSGFGGGALTFTTCLDNYPLLGPHYTPRARLSDGLSLAEHHTRFLYGLAHMTTPRRDNAGLDSATKPAADEPHPADLHALGVIYYKILTATHPYLDHEFTRPCWLGGEVHDAHPVGFDPAIARTKRAVTRARALAPDVTEAEEALARALLDLQVTTRARLLDHLVEIARAESLRSVLRYIRHRPLEE